MNDMQFAATIHSAPVSNEFRKTSICVIKKMGIAAANHDTMMIFNFKGAS